MKEKLRTTDLFRSASLLCQGASLEGVQRSEAGLSFVLAGEALSEADEQYRTGSARVNPLELKLQLNKLRDMVFGRREIREVRDDCRSTYL